MERYQKHELVEKSRKSIMINNFLGGISWGVGIMLGATIVIGIIVIILEQMSWVPIIGDTLLAISEYIATNSQNVPR